MTRRLKKYSDMDGSELMVLYQQDDMDAFNYLYGRYKSLVYGYLFKRLGRRYEVDEVFQDVFLRLHNTRFRYKGELPFEPWLYTLLRNSLIDYYRKMARQFQDVSLDSLDVVPPALCVEDTHTPDRLLPENVKLSKSQRQAIELRYGKDFSFDEIAARLGTTPANTRQLVSRALKKLRKFFSSGGGR